MSECARRDCLHVGTKKCSVCLREAYCSGHCQKLDWKLHKLICKTLKNLSHDIKAYHEVVRIIEEIREIPWKEQVHARALGHLITYAKHQFGDRVREIAYRERASGERIDNWEIEIKILIPIYMELVR